MIVPGQSTAIKDRECFTLISFSSWCRIFLALGSSSLHVNSPCLTFGFLLLRFSRLRLKQMKGFCIINIKHISNDIQYYFNKGFFSTPSQDEAVRFSKWQNYSPVPLWKITTPLALIVLHWIASKHQVQHVQRRKQFAPAAIS